MVEVDCDYIRGLNLVMARKGSHQKNGMDNQTKQRKKASDSLLSTKGEGKTSEAESVLKENCHDDKQTSSPVCDTLERDMDAVKGAASLKDIDQPVSSENNLAGDRPRNEPGFTTEETRYIPFGREHIDSVMRSLLDILSTNSPTENIELAYNAVLRKLRISTATISREITKCMERHRPLIDSVKSRVYKSRDLFITKIRQVFPVVFRWLMHFGSIILLLSLVWLDCAIRGFDSFIRMGTASFFSIMWCGLFSAFSMIGMTKFILILVRISNMISYMFTLYAYVKYSRNTGCNCSGVVVHWICCWGCYPCHFWFGFAMALW